MERRKGNGREICWIGITKDGMMKVRRTNNIEEKE
jgi:hypothetical protein